MIEAQVCKSLKFGYRDVSTTIALKNGTPGRSREKKKKKHVSKNKQLEACNPTELRGMYFKRKFSGIMKGKLLC